MRKKLKYFSLETEFIYRQLKPYLPAFALDRFHVSQTETHLLSKLQMLIQTFFVRSYL